MEVSAGHFFLSLSKLHYKRTRYRIKHEKDVGPMVSELWW